MPECFGAQTGQIDPEAAASVMFQFVLNDQVSARFCSRSTSLKADAHVSSKVMHSHFMTYFNDVDL